MAKLNQWYLYNGRRSTIDGLEKLSVDDQNDIVRFISNLKICHKLKRR